MNLNNLKFVSQQVCYDEVIYGHKNLDKILMISVNYASHLPFVDGTSSGRPAPVPRVMGLSSAVPSASGICRARADRDGNTCCAVHNNGMTTNTSPIKTQLCQCSHAINAAAAGTFGHTRAFNVKRLQMAT